MSEPHRSRGKPIRALIVDDSPSNGGSLTSVLERGAEITVIGQTPLSSAAVGMVARESPDVLILNLRNADDRGRHFIEQVMAHTPTPILVLSSATADRHSLSAVEALVSGALDVLPAPDRWTADLETQLRRSVRQISKVQTIRHPRGGLRKSADSQALPGNSQRGKPVVALAASTGGPSALATVLSGLAGLPAPVLVVQHLHPDFTGGLLDCLGRTSALPVQIATHDQAAQPGQVYLAPGGFHLRIAANLRLELKATPVTIHRPSADELFLSLAEHIGPAGVGVLMTGMGDDGAQGLLAMHRQRAHTFGQDAASCAVFGMPQAAQRLGAVTSLMPPDQLANAILRAVSAVRV